MQRLKLYNEELIQDILDKYEILELCYAMENIIKSINLLM